VKQMIIISSDQRIDNFRTLLVIKFGIKMNKGTAKKIAVPL